MKAATTFFYDHIKFQLNYRIVNLDNHLNTSRTESIKEETDLCGFEARDGGTASNVKSYPKAHRHIFLVLSTPPNGSSLVSYISSVLKPFWSIAAWSWSSVSFLY